MDSSGSGPGVRPKGRGWPRHILGLDAGVADPPVSQTAKNTSRRAAPCVVSRVGFYALQTSSETAWHGEHLCVACVAAQLQLRRHGSYFP